MRKELLGFALIALFSVATAAGAQVKVEDHLLGETAEQFFSEAHEGVILSACAKKDFGKVNRSIKKTGKEYCAWLSSIRQSMVRGESGQYNGEVSPDNTKTTTYVFAAGKFSAAVIVFTAPDMANNYQGKSFAEVLSGLKGIYGPPTSETIILYQSAYGVPYERHQELWLAESYAIQVDEQPGSNGWTSVDVSTRELYDKLKTANRTKPLLNPLN
jgi:hypothetical protein